MFFPKHFCANHQRFAQTEFSKTFCNLGAMGGGGGVCNPLSLHPGPYANSTWVDSGQALPKQAYLAISCVFIHCEVETKFTELWRRVT